MISFVKKYPNPLPIILSGTEHTRQSQVMRLLQTSGLTPLKIFKKEH